jgi:hypothetical protein
MTTGTGTNRRAHKCRERASSYFLDTPIAALATGPSRRDLHPIAPHEGSDTAEALPVTDIIADRLGICRRATSSLELELEH